jgi:hypothetical protein
MNAEECARLVSVVRTLYPAQRFDEDPTNVVRAWGFVVADVDYGEAHAAVVKLARRGVQWCSPGLIRHEVAAARHVLAPDADALLADVREVARREGVGRRDLHPVARRVYESVGGALSIARMDSRGLLQLRRALADAIESYDNRVLDEPLPPPRPEHVAIAARPRDATPPELAVSEADLTPPELYGERAKSLREFIEGGGQS